MGKQFESQTGLRILMVAPQPFFSARGTPFSVLHRVRALTTLGHRVDLVTYPLGESVQMQGLTIIRSGGIPLVKKVKIGPSIAKIFLDIRLYFTTRRALKRGTYDVFHSHEEAAFFAMGLCRKYRIPHIYDMHSSLPQQLSNFKAYNIAFIRNIFESLERKVLRTCDGVITICDDLAKVVERVAPEKPHSMIENTGDDRKVFPVEGRDLKTELKLNDKRIVLYTGTLEAYQGIDLLLESMSNVVSAVPDTILLMVGGSPTQVETYRAMSRQLGIAESVVFFGTLHPSRIPAFMDVAEVIVSPRSRGTNTPLKIYGYMRSGKPLVATDRHTHTQLLTPDVAELTPADSDSFAAGLVRVLTDPAYADKLGEAARQYAEAHFADEKYIEAVERFYRTALGNRPENGVEYRQRIA